MDACVDMCLYGFCVTKLVGLMCSRLWQLLFELVSTSGEDVSGVWAGTVPLSLLPPFAPRAPDAPLRRRPHFRGSPAGDPLTPAHHALISGGLYRAAARLVSTKYP